MTQARTFAYCRVSTGDQTTEHQMREIAATGVAIQPQRIISETVSGSTPALSRPQFAKLVDKLEAGDVLYVTKMDRLGRAAGDVAATVKMLEAKAVRVHCLQLGGMDLTSATGKLTMGVLNHVAEFERDLLIERTQSGLRTAKARGVKLGRKPALSAERVQEARARHAAGESIRTLAKALGASPTTVSRALLTTA